MMETIKLHINQGKVNWMFLNAFEWRDKFINVSQFASVLSLSHNSLALWGNKYTNCDQYVTPGFMDSWKIKLSSHISVGAGLLEDK